MSKTYLRLQIAMTSLPVAVYFGVYAGGRMAHESMKSWLEHDPINVGEISNFIISRACMTAERHFLSVDCLHPLPRPTFQGCGDGQNPIHSP